MGQEFTGQTRQELQWVPFKFAPVSFELVAEKCKLDRESLDQESRFDDCWLVFMSRRVGLHRNTSFLDVGTLVTARDATGLSRGTSRSLLPAH